jgi:hypothetical protein
LYVRQSTIRQVFENTESTRRQYALRQRAVSWGWPVERVIVLDSDQGQSGASTVDREGFKKPVSEVGLGRAGIALGLGAPQVARELSPVARQQRLLLTHGTQDPLIPLAPVRAQVAALKAADLDVEWREFDKAHTIAGEEELTVIRHFVESCYGEKN